MRLDTDPAFQTPLLNSTGEKFPNDLCGRFSFYLKRHVRIHPLQLTVLSLKLFQAL